MTLNNGIMENNIKIAFTGWWWWMSHEKLLERFKELTPNHSGKWKNIIGVDNYEDADYIIVFERKGFKQFKNKGNKPEIYLKSEPNALQLFDNFSSKFHSKPYVPGGIWWINKSFEYLDNLKYSNLNKSNILTSITSVRHITKGHKFRLNTLKEFSSKYPESIDIYGKEKLKSFINEKSFKKIHNTSGIPNFDTDKFHILKDYKYEIVIENSQQKDYWTEKISDSLLSYCMPIYWGCPNILDYFPKEALHLLDDSKDTTEQIYNIINTDIKRENIEAIEYSRQLILHEYNLWNIIYRIINNVE